MSKNRELLDQLILSTKSQIEKYFKNNLVGYFFTIKQALPTLLNISIDQEEDLLNDKSLEKWLNFSNCEMTYFNGNQFLSHSSSTLEHGNNLSFISMISTSNTKITSLENPKNCKFISFHWALESYFLLNRIELNKLQIEIYDFINNFKSRRYSLLRFIFTRKYRKLKYEISKYQILYAIFNDEFDENKKFGFYISGTTIPNFENHYFCGDQEKKELFYIKKVNQIMGYAKINTAITNKLNSRFRPIEELQNFNTSTALDLSALVLSLIAFILTFEYIINFVRYIFKFINGE